GLRVGGACGTCAAAHEVDGFNRLGGGAGPLVGGLGIGEQHIRIPQDARVYAAAQLLGGGVGVEEFDQVHAVERHGGIHPHHRAQLVVVGHRVAVRMVLPVGLRIVGVVVGFDFDAAAAADQRELDLTALVRNAGHGEEVVVLVGRGGQVVGTAVLHGEDVL